MGTINTKKEKRRRLPWKTECGRRQFFRGLGLGMFGTLFVCSLFYIAFDCGKQQKAAARYEELQQEPEIPAVQDIQEILEEEVSAEESGQTDLALWRSNTIDFEELWKVNEDVCAWIEIPGTQVDYPVLQHPTDDEYYLNHTIDRVEGRPGSIYSEKIHSKDFSASNTILYGHNMKNRTMFGTLHQYEEESFFREYPYVYIYLPDRTLVYQVFAAAVFSDAYLPWYCDFETEEGFASFFEEIRECAVCYDGDAAVSFGDHVLTLSTCVDNDADRRFLVEAVLTVEYPR